MLLENEQPIGPPLPSNDESTRIAALRGYCVLDTMPDKLCDQVTQLARCIFGTEIALVSLIDEHRQWFKSRAGLDVIQTPRSDSFCAHAISTQGMVVLDTHEDSRFVSNILVTGEPYIRFYAGALLVTPQGQALGTLCIIDSRPRSHFDSSQVAQLEQLAAIVMERIEQLRNRGYIDNVTALPNRAKLMEVLRTRQYERSVTRLPCTAVAVDICPREYLFDMVKALGWDYAEAFLAKIGRTLRQALGSTPVYRVTTTTFVYLDEGLPVQCELRLAEVQRFFAHGMEIHGIPHQLDIAVGILPEVDQEMGSDVIRSLLTAIDVGREEGMSPYLFENRHADKQRYAFWILSVLPIALSGPSELELYYQPKVRLSDGAFAGVEALIRWNHPVMGNISPEIFITLAEKTAQIRQITAWVLRHAVTQASNWLAGGLTIPISINTSARDFESDELQHLLVTLLQQYPVPPDLIEIEFTESAMANHPAKVRQRIDAIRHLGVKISIDDFGAGFSNLNYLKTIPADILKIDRGFIQQLLDDVDDQVIVPSIIHMAHTMGFSVVAEGVENERTAKILYHLGCDYAQGYAIGRPMPAAQFEGWLNDNRITNPGGYKARNG